MKKIKNWFDNSVKVNNFIVWVLLWLKVKPEYLSPLNWKLVDQFDMLRLVTKSTNVLVLKSSKANDPDMRIYESAMSDFYMYKDNSELIFLFDGKINQTTNNNLKLNWGGKHDFKFELITIHSKFITYFIIKVIHFFTKKLLEKAKQINQQFPVVKKPLAWKDSNDFFGMNEQEVINRVIDSGMVPNPNLSARNQLGNITKGIQFEGIDGVLDGE